MDIGKLGLMNAAPYVTFVTYGRNDGYTPSYVQRVRRALQCLAGQLERAGIDSEIIITDWNPPPDRPYLLEVLDLPKALKHVSIWAVIVGAEHHAGFAGAQERNFHAGEAANVGLRRARGRFVVAKSSDTFFSPQTIGRIAGEDLDVDTMYRICRHDVAITDDRIWDLDDEALLASLAALPSSVHGLITQPEQWDIRDLHTNACGDFTLMSAAYWHLLRGYPRDPSVLALDGDSLIMHAAAALGTRVPLARRLPRLQAGSRKPCKRACEAGLATLATAARQAPVGKGRWTGGLLGTQIFRLSAPRRAGCRIGAWTVDRTQFRGACHALGTWRKACANPARGMGIGRRAARKSNSVPFRMGRRDL